MAITAQMQALPQTHVNVFYKHTGWRVKIADSNFVIDGSRVFYDGKSIDVPRSELRHYAYVFGRDLNNDALKVTETIARVLNFAYKIDALNTKTHIAKVNVYIGDMGRVIPNPKEMLVAYARRYDIVVTPAAIRNSAIIPHEVGHIIQNSYRIQEFVSRDQFPTSQVLLEAGASSFEVSFSTRNIENKNMRTEEAIYRLCVDSASKLDHLSIMRTGKRALYYEDFGAKAELRGILRDIPNLSINPGKITPSEIDRVFEGSARLAIVTLIANRFDTEKAASELILAADKYTTEEFVSRLKRRIAKM